MSGFALPVDPMEVSRVAPQLPATQYRVRIAGAADGAEPPTIKHTDPKAADKSPKPFVNLRLIIEETADGNTTVISQSDGAEMSCVDKSIFDSLFLTSSDGAMRRVRLFLEAFGIQLNTGADGNPELPVDDDGATISEWVGLTGVINTKLGQPRNGTRYLEVASYVPAE